MTLKLFFSKRTLTLNFDNSNRLLGMDESFS